MPLLSQVLGIGAVKPVQRGIISVTTGFQFTVPITPVDPAWTELRLLGGMPGFNTGDGTKADLGYIFLDPSGSAIGVRSSGTPTYPTKLSWELTERYPS